MDYRKSQRDDLELNEASVENKNRKPLANVLPNEQVPNKKLFTDVLPNQKTTFRTRAEDPNDGAENDGSEPITGKKITFAYGGDKGVETQSEVTK